MFLPSFDIRDLSGPTVLFADTFTDTTGTALTSHTPDTDVEGGGYTLSISVGTDAANIQSNALAFATLSDTSTKVHTFDIGQSDYILECTITRCNHLVPKPGLDIRFVDSNNGWRVLGRGSSTTVDLVERVSGSNTTQASGGTWSSAEESTFKVTCDNESITVLFEGVTTLSYGSASSHKTSTISGLRSSCNASVSVSGKHDDLMVTSL